MEKREYCDEIALIQEQNDVEIEIYPLAADVIAETLKGKNLSKRYVFARRLTELGHIYYGISSFPDIAILDKDFNNSKNKDITKDNRDKLKGCIEVKALNSPLCSVKDLKHPNESNFKLEDIGQLLGEILWYKKVLYTNGSEWKFFTCETRDYDDEIIGLAKQSRNNKITNEQDEKKQKGTILWLENTTIKEAIQQGAIQIDERIISANCEKNWDEFMRPSQILCKPPKCSKMELTLWR